MSLTHCRLKAPTDPSSGSSNLLEQLMELKKTLTFTSLLKDVIKGYR